MADTPVKDVFDDENPDEANLGTHGVDGDGQDTDSGGGDGADAGAGVAAPGDDLQVVIADDDPDDPDLNAGGDDTETGGGGDDTLTGSDAGADDDGGDPEDKKYSQRVQERIARERRVTARVRQESAAEVLAERKSRFAAEKKALEAQESLAGVLLDNLDGRIKALTGELKTAKEGGDTDKELELQSQLDDLRAKKREVEGGKVSLERSKAELTEREKTELTTTARAAPPSTQRWLDRNRWFGHPAFKAESVLARVLDAEVSKTGLRPDDPRYFQELDRLIARDAPDLKGKIARVLRTGPGQPRRGAGAAPVGRSQQQQPASRGQPAASAKRIVLTRQDLETMRTFRLDPTNPEHQKEFARNKLARGA